MLVFFLKRFVRLGLSVFCPKIHLKNRMALSEKGPILLLANHPNSFLDAIILGAYYQRKMHFLARGDVFENPLFGYLLRKIGMIPIHRIREGKEHLHKNSSTFQEAVEILQAGGAVLIFIEGICLNHHEIQPFKKGATRILEGAHQIGTFPIIHVASLGYSSFTEFGKIVNIQIERMDQGSIMETSKDRLDFNHKVKEIMERNLDVPQKHEVRNKGPWDFFVLPYYQRVRHFVAQKTQGTVFYDSVLFAVLLFTFPIYVLALLLFIGLGIHCLS
jgi:1-acyl-sn-glycerol-3-phosphate acyltransferase